MRSEKQPYQYHEIDYPVQGNTGTFGNIHLHWHTYYEVELCCGGYTKQLINGIEYRMEPGMVSIMTPQDFHKYEGNCILKKFIFKENFISDEITRFLLEPSRPRIVRLHDSFEQLSDNFSRIIETFRTDDPLAVLRLRNIVESVCIDILSQKNTSEKHEICDGYSVQLNTVLAYIREHFHEPITLEEIASTVYLSANYFSRWFSGAVGVTFSEYVRNCRIHYASVLLLSTEQSIEEIAWQVGYSSVSFFNRIFREQYGMSPLVYRKTFRGF